MSIGNDNGLSHKDALSKKGGSNSSANRKDTNRWFFLRGIVVAVLIQCAYVAHFYVNLSEPSPAAMEEGEFPPPEADPATVEEAPPENSGAIQEESLKSTLAAGGRFAKILGGPRSKHAYAFLMAGCDPAKPSYRGYLYNVMVSAYLLNMVGSESDVVVMVRMSSESSLESLPDDEEAVLRAANVRIFYLPKAQTDTFYSAMINKFEILGMHDYTRIIFLDSDVIPLCNLDYVFKLSEGPDAVLRENLVLAWKTEPAQGGFFMLSPGPGQLEELLRVVEIREERSRDLPWPPFDPVWGWGHVIQPPDYWETFRNERGTNWTFYGVFADQGLLYHWVKYVKKSVSIVKDNELQTWHEVPTEGLKKVKTERNVLKKYQCFPEKQFKRSKMEINPPYSDYHHFVSNSKPWMPKHKPPPDIKSPSAAKTPMELWYHILRRVNKKYGMNLNVEKLRVGRPALGLFPLHIDMLRKREAQDATLNETLAETATATDDKAKDSSSSVEAPEDTKDPEDPKDDESQPDLAVQKDPSETVRRRTMTSDGKDPFLRIVGEPRSRYAYAFLMAGCDPADSAYRGYLYNIMVSAHILEMEGSEADVVVMVRMSSKSSHESLPEHEEAWLRASNIRLFYLPTAQTDTFYSAMINKFEILAMQDYKRIIFLDSDVIPLCNVDYVFKLSDGPDAILRENVVLVWKFEPAQGGFFMLSPGAGELEELLKVVRIREEKSRDLPWPPFDPVWGWGHVIEPPDHWVTLRGQKGTNWTFYGGFADQGLLYHWVKYVKKSVSMIKDDEVQTWIQDPDSPNEDDVPKKVKTEKELLKQYACSKPDRFRRTKFERSPPYSDFHHFVSTSKPWMPRHTPPSDVESPLEAETPMQLWYHILRKINKKYDMNLDITKLKVGRPALGLFPLWIDMLRKREAQDAAENATLANQTLDEESAATG